MRGTENQAIPFSSLKQIANNNDRCLECIWNIRFGNLRTCPRCSKYSTFHRCKNKKCWQCAQCAHPISPLAGTIFHKSSIPLSQWFDAINLLYTQHDVSAKSLQRRLHCTYKTAWRMRSKIRALLAHRNFNGSFTHAFAKSMPKSSAERTVH